MQRSRKLLLAVLKKKKKNEQADKGKNEQLDKKWTNGQIEGTLDFTLWIKKP